MREIKQQGDKPGKWSDALAFTVTASTSSTSATGGTRAARAGVNAAGGNGNGNASPNQEILDRLSDIEDQLTELLNPVKKETCIEWGAELEGGVDAEGKAHLEADASAGAKGFGNGIKAAIAAKAEVKLAGGLKGNLGIKRSRCFTPLIFGSTRAAGSAASLAASDEASDAEFIAGLQTLAGQLQLGEDRIRAALDVLPSFSAGAEPWALLRSDGTLAKLGGILPLPDAIRTKLSDPEQLISQFRAQMNLCGQPNLPPALAGLIGEFCQLASTERFGTLLDRVDGAVQQVKGVVHNIETSVNTVKSEVNSLYCRIFCGPGSN